ncbi:MAG: RDD family protein [Marinicellaceae bacterium]
MSDSAYPWNILDIEQTDDKKVIKNAYAKLIKQFRPDESPEKFQEIQEAYQYAQNLIKSENQNNTNYDEPENPLANNNNSSESNEFKITSCTEDSEQQLIANRIRSKLEFLLNQPQNTIDTVSNWSVFKDYKKIDDIELKNNVSLNVFKLIAEFNLENLNNNNLPCINIYNIQFLDKIFNWSDNWRELETIFPPEYIQVTLLQYEKATAIDISSTPFFSRALAGYLDYCVAILFLYFINFISNKLLEVQYEESDKYIFLFSILLFYRILMESFLPSRRSLGKVARELFIINKHGILCTFKKSIIRHLIIVLYFSPIIINNLFFQINELLILLVVFIVILTNLITLGLKGALIHDLVSKTYVIQGKNE